MTTMSSNKSHRRCWTTHTWLFTWLFEAVLGTHLGANSLYIGGTPCPRDSLSESDHFSHLRAASYSYAPGTLPNRAYYVAIYLCTIELNLETLPSLISLLLKPLRRTGASTEVDNPIAAKVYWNHQRWIEIASRSEFIRGYLATENCYSVGISYIVTLPHCHIEHFSLSSIYMGNCAISAVRQ